MAEILAKALVALSPLSLWFLLRIMHTIHVCLDGVVFTRPPEDPVERENYCKADITRVWRWPEERNLPDLAGCDRYAKQVPTERIVPLWGGVGCGGFAPVLWRPHRKTNRVEWTQALTDGKLQTALAAINPSHRRGRCPILCDSETFLRAPLCRCGVSPREDLGLEDAIQFPRSQSCRENVGMGQKEASQNGLGRSRCKAAHSKQDGIPSTHSPFADKFSGAIGSQKLLQWSA